MTFRTAWHQHSASDGVAQRYFDQDGRLVRQKVQDVAPVIDGNTRIRNETNGRTKGGGRFVGRIPAVVYHEWLKEWTAKGMIAPGTPGGMDRLNDLLVQRLKNSDFSKFRTTDGGI